jgi:3-hydroxymyristoyl/3-hydroxydecanoyl-(acyl carrier protein) dehydratase
MADTPRWRKIPASHPALPGHFPGHPVVPGVVILSEVWDSVAAAATHPVRCTGWPNVKFLAPLQPEEAFTIEVEFTSQDAARFTCRSAERGLAQGSVRFAGISGGHE